MTQLLLELPHDEQEAKARGHLQRVVMPPAGVALVACVAGKLSVPAPARDLYTSQWFCKARTLVERRGWDWRILSAAHGLIHPNTVIEPYDETLNNMAKHEREWWARRVRIAAYEEFVIHSDKTHTFMLLAGRRYREGLVDWLRRIGDDVLIPMEGLGIGEQLRWLKEQAA